MSNDGLVSISLPRSADETLKRPIASHGHILQCAKAKIRNQKEHHSDAWFFNHPEIVIVYGSQGLLHFFGGIGLLKRIKRYVRFYPITFPVVLLRNH